MLLFILGLSNDLYVLGTKDGKGSYDPVHLSVLNSPLPFRSLVTQ